MTTNERSDAGDGATMRGLSDILRSRCSVRAFLDRDVADDQVRGLLSVASRAPSSRNVQPWRVYVVRRPTMLALDRAIATDGNNRPGGAQECVEPYDSRRAQWERQLFSLLKLDPRDSDVRRQLSARERLFFGAPVGLLVTADERLSDDERFGVGMFVQTFLLAAENAGLGTCVHAAYAGHEDVLREMVGLGEHDRFVCGIALGHADAAASENWLTSSRADQDEWVRFVPDAHGRVMATPSRSVPATPEREGRRGGRLRRPEWLTLPPRGGLDPVAG